jgi:myotubularin-related protein 1/2
MLVVPNSVSDDQLRTVAQFRSRGRLPALCWKHPGSMAVMLRCSQPRVGIRGARCGPDEALFAAISASNPLAEHVHIIDARPRLNAVANTARGAGFENTDHYAHTELRFMDIENIHKVRDSMVRLAAFVAAVPPGDRAWLSGLESTQWLAHIRTIMVATCDVRPSARLLPRH